MQMAAEPDAPRPVAPAELGFERIVYEKAPPRATIRLNRPEVLNAFDFQMLRELARACEDASWDDEIRVVVVTGTGRAFCVGADLKSWGAELVGNPREYWKWFGAFKDAHDRLREIGKPTVARVQGIAVGGGNELQMACDLAVMVDDAFIRHVGPEHGSVPAGGATQWLPIFVGDRRAREILMLCEQIPARQAAEWGLVNWAVPRAELDAKVDEVVEKLAAKLPQTIRYTKQQLNWGRDLSWQRAVNHPSGRHAHLTLREQAHRPVGHDPGPSDTRRRSRVRLLSRRRLRARHALRRGRRVGDREVRSAGDQPRRPARRRRYPAVDTRGRQGS